MSVNYELHKSGDRSCMHIEFDISGSKLRYDAGDHVAVFPVNDAEIVEKLGARLKVDLGTVITLTNLDGVFLMCSWVHCKIVIKIPSICTTDRCNFYEYQLQLQIL